MLSSFPLAACQPSPIRPTEAQLWLFPLVEESEVSESALVVLTAQEASRAERFRFERDRTAFVVMRATLRILLGKLLGRSPANVPIVQIDGGKPFVADVEGLDFSVSHTAGRGMIGLASVPIGVDVEAIRHIPDQAEIIARFFAPGEVAVLAKLPDGARQEAFFACWTRKEAYVKARGLGLAAALDAFEVSVDPDRPALLAIDGSSTQAAAWSLWSDRLPSGIWAAAAVDRPRTSFALFTTEERGVR